MSLHELNHLAKSSQATLDSLRAQLFAHGGHAYVIIDPILGSPWKRPWQDPANPRSLTREFTLSLEKFGVEKTRSPFLMELADSRSLLLDESFELALEENSNLLGAHRVCGWFSSPLSPIEICKLLQRHMIRQSAQGAWLFRLYDPRTLRHLPYILGPSFALHGMHAWFCMDVQSRLMRVAGCPNERTQQEVPESAWPSLDVIAVVNAAYDQWRDLAETMPGDAFVRLFDAAKRGVKLGLRLDQVADCTSFMLHRCLIHQAVERHPVIAAWIEAARHGRVSYADAAAASSEQLWKEIESGEWFVSQGARYG